MMLQTAFMVVLIGLSQSSAGESPSVQIAPPVHAENEELHAYLVEAFEHNPMLQSLHARWLAALQRIPQVTSLDDPMFGFGYFAKSRDKDYWVSLGQRFPWFGTLRLRGEEAAHEAEAARARLMVERNRIQLEVKTAYYELAMLHEVMALLEAENMVIEELEALVRDRYALALDMQDDVLRLESEREQHHDLVASLAQERPSVAAMLNEATGRDLLAEVPVPQSMPLPEAPPDPEILAALIQRFHPELHELEAMIDAAGAGVALARKTGFPEITLEAMYEFGRDPGRTGMDPTSPGRIATYRNLTNTALGRMPFSAGDTAIDLYDLRYREPMIGYDEWKVNIEFTLPIWRKRVRAAVSEAEQNLRAVEQEQTAALRRLEGEAHRALFLVQDAARQYRLVEERLLPTAEQTTAVVRERYATGMDSAMFADVLMATQDELMLRRMRAELLRDWRAASAQLEFLLGGAVESAPSEGE